MLFKNLIRLALLACVCTMPLAAKAQDRATKEEAVAMVTKAGEYLKQNGVEKAAAAFNDPKNMEFRNKDLYIFMFRLSDGTRLAHGTKQALVGKSIADMSDVKGKAYGKEMMDAMSKAETAWVDYFFLDPIQNEIKEKSSYLIKVGEYAVAGGVYK
ncbi:MAG: cache domain-containing protein [Alphaproteobacteria bacterium]|nr:MAG: cache domain-containing protein [Alphaproteobacteria bacterium]